MRQQRSPFSTTLGDVGDCLIEAQFDSVAALDTVQYLIHRREVCEVLQLGNEILLKRSTRSLGSSLEFSVDVSRYISDQYVRHAYIMQA